MGLKKDKRNKCLPLTTQNGIMQAYKKKKIHRHQILVSTILGVKEKR